MNADPLLVVPPAIKAWSDRLIPLWTQALGRANTELQSQAALAVVKARADGMPGLEEMAGTLAATLENPDTRLPARIDLARALIALDARAYAHVLLKFAQADGLDAALLADPALARWDHQPAYTMWAARLTDPDAPRTMVFSALQAIGQVRAASASDRLRRMTLDRELDPGLRLEAARALGRVRSTGLESDARALSADGAIVSRLAAALMLEGHDSPPARSLLTQLAQDAEPSVAAAALRRLLDIDPRLVAPLTRSLMNNPDANVRLLVVRAIHAQRSVSGVTLLGTMLDDAHPDVRAAARGALLDLETDRALARPVREAVTRMLETDRWRGLEQSCLIAGVLDHEPAAGRLVELLDFDRAEVFITAAWALGRLAVPATYPALLDKAQREAESAQAFASARPADNTPVDLVAMQNRWDRDKQVAQIFQCFGRQRYAPAEPLMRRFIPKAAPFGAESRAAAVWALGHLHEGKSDSDLVSLFSSRLSDVNPLNPEAEPVRRMSAVSLGRLKARRALGTLNNFYKLEALSSEVGGACGWAIEQITGSPPEAIPQKPALQTGWFLEPSDD